MGDNSSKFIKGTDSISSKAKIGNVFAKNNDLTNFTTQGVELIARDDEDVTPAQIQAATRLAKLLGYKSNQVFGHPELKKGQNPPTYREGMSAVDRIRGTSLTPLSPRTSQSSDRMQ